jgi:hypothetical protein
VFERVVIIIIYKIGFLSVFSSKVINRKTRNNREVMMDDLNWYKLDAIRVKRLEKNEIDLRNVNCCSVVDFIHDLHIANVFGKGL